MKKLLYGLLAIFLVSCSLIPKLDNTTAILISNVNIVDVRSGQILQNRQVVIDSGKIKSISEDIEQRIRFSMKIDGKGKYLMPGLAEMHAHIPPPMTDAQRVEDVLFLYLSNGITTIRGMLGDPAHLDLREQAKNGKILSPRIFTSSPSLNGNSVTTKEEAIEKVSSYKREGYDFLKIHPGIAREVFDQVVTTANEVGIEFAGHVPVDVGIRHALESKYASIDHVDGFLEGLVPESANVKPNENGFFGYNFTNLADTSKIDELVAKANENEVWIVPTQSLFTKWFAPTDADELLALPEMKYMPTATLENWKQRKEESTGKGTGFTKEQWQKFDSIRKKLIKKLQDNGYGMLLGSDAPQLFNVPGFSIHKEMQDMADAGMTNLEIIQSGTINPAKYFKMSTIFGEVKEGLDADLILLYDNPIENLGALKNISGVVRQGKWLPRSEIGQRLHQIVKDTGNKVLENQEDSTLSKKMMGTWQYYGAKDEGEGSAKIRMRIKNMYDGHYNIEQKDPETGRILFYHGGRYNVKDNGNVETRLEYANYRTSDMIGDTGTSKIEIEGNTLTQTGIDNDYNEVWEKQE